MGSALRLARTTLVLLAVASCAAPPAPPPDATAAMRFLPQDYEAELLVDYDELRELDVLEWIDELPMAPGFFSAIARGYGCELDDLHLVRSGVRLDGEDGRVQHRLVSVAVRAPGAPVELANDWKPTRIAGRDGFEQDFGAGRSLLVFPGDGFALAGDADLVERGLAEAQGRPHADLAPLLAGERVAAQIAIGRFGRAMHAVTGTFGWYWHDESDPADFVRLRLSRGGEDHLVVEGLVRFQKGETGLAEFEGDVRKALESALARPDLRAMHDLVRSVVVERDGRDVRIRVDLGTPRQAFAAIERLFLGLAALRSRG